MVTDHREWQKKTTLAEKVIRFLTNNTIPCH